ncbi:phage protein [Streptococcus pneumoniae]|nr:phage protein [Streptococcus pneumoniae]
MNIKALIKKYEELWNEHSPFYEPVPYTSMVELFLKELKQLDEPEKVKVPQFVADWIEEARKSCKDVADFFDFDFTNEEVGKWFMQERPFDLVARAWLDGYEVEEESKYIVKVKATGQCLGKYYINNEILSPRFIYTGRHADSFTRKELEEADFSWVFDCDGVGVEEVE